MIPKWNLYKEARRPKFDRRCGLSKMQVLKALSLEFIIQDYESASKTRNAGVMLGIEKL